MDWLNEIDSITAEFQREFAGLDAEKLNWKPDAKTWSIAQNIEHLIVINQTYFPVLDKLKAGNYKLPFIAKIGFMVRFFGKLILGAVQPDRKKKMKTFSIWEPDSSDISADILARFVAHQNQLKEQIAAAADLVKKGAVISSPANKNIVYKLETAFDIIVTHERRHLQQARELVVGL